MTITYQHPLERTLLLPERDANCFFHIYEATWMLAGRNDLAPLAYYVKDFGNFSDDGRTLNGAYGYRWRHARTLGEVHTIHGEERDQGGLTGPGKQTRRATGRVDEDQLGILVKHLQTDPNSRRAVLSMWNVEDDLLKVDTSRDTCCNLAVTFLLRWNGICPTCDGEWTKVKAVALDEDYATVCLNCAGHPAKPYRLGIPGAEAYLDMTVFNRSNDAVWGTFGANAVHFSFLQEYMANALGVYCGNYHQVSSNLHIYQRNWKPEEWMKREITRTDTTPCRYMPLFQQPGDRVVFDEEVKEFARLNANGEEVTANTTWRSPFLAEIAQPLLHAFHMHKQRDYPAAYHWLARVQHADWVAAGYEWIRKRQLNRERKEDERRAKAAADYGGQPAQGEQSA